MKFTEKPTGDKHYQIGFATSIELMQGAFQFAYDPNHPDEIPFYWFGETENLSKSAFIMFYDQAKKDVGIHNDGDIPGYIVYHGQSQVLGQSNPEFIKMPLEDDNNVIIEPKSDRYFGVPIANNGDYLTIFDLTVNFPFLDKIYQYRFNFDHVRTGHTNGIIPATNVVSIAGNYSILYKGSY